MIRKLLPLLLALIGLGVGAGVGLLLRPPEEAATEAEHPVPEPEPTPTKQPEFVKLNNQFVVPVVENARLGAMVVLTIGLEVDPELADAVHSREPKLRDEFLQVLFSHANSGGFNGSFTEARTLGTLRTGLLEAARKVVGPGVRGVLISDLVRQDS